MMKKNMFGGMVAIALLLAGCGANASSSEDSSASSSASADTIKIGANFELSGNVSAYGTAEFQGVQLAVDDINAAGGVLGKQIELISYDNKSTPTEVASVATKLASKDQVAAIVGPATSPNTEAAIVSAERAGIPMVTPSGETAEPSDYLYRIAFQDSHQGIAAANFASNNLGAKKAVILGDSSSDYAESIAQAFKDNFDGEIVAHEYFSSGEANFNAMLTNIKAMDFDVLFIPGYYEQGGPIIKQAREMGITQPIIGSDGFANDKLVELAVPENVDDVYYIAHFSYNSDDQYIQDFIAGYQEKFDMKPDVFSGLGYDAMMLVAKGIEAAGTTEADSLMDAMDAIKDFQGVTGTFTIDAEHNPIKSITIIELQDGVETAAHIVPPIE